jgi:hypothetical protein
MPFEDDTHTPHPLLVFTGLYISPISARQLLAPPVTLNRILISHVGIAPRIGKLVNDSVGMVGLVMEYSVDANEKLDGTLEIVATPELSEEYENVPALLDEGAVSEKNASAKTYDPNFGPSMNGPNVGFPAFTVTVVVTEPLM